MKKSSLLSVLLWLLTVISIQLIYHILLTGGGVKKSRRGDATILIPTYLYMYWHLACAVGG